VKDLSEFAPNKTSYFKNRKLWPLTKKNLHPPMLRLAS
jgi:hypothetical protein